MLPADTAISCESVKSFAKARRSGVDHCEAPAVVNDPRSKERQLWDGVDFITPVVEED
ncbi:hypothetical protein [Streptomyces sp. NPDC005989]|uniref:hypothetical protein n=1 Tax=Streptomyces sp. NPDC005989 TaxID=3156727 RepID=UPI0033DD0182